MSWMILFFVISYGYVTAVCYVVSVVGQLTERISEDKEGGGKREKDTEQKGQNEEREKWEYIKREREGRERCDEHQPGCWEYFIPNKHSCSDIFLDQYRI